MEAAPGLAVALAATRLVEHAFHAVSDEDLLTGLAEVEALGRLVDALRVAAAAEVETRSDTRYGQERLAFRHGARDAVELVQQVARIDVKEAKERIALGCALAPTVSLLGDVLPGRYPELADAVISGTVGLGAAREIVNTVKQLAPRVAASDLEAMVVTLTEEAAVLDVPALHAAIDRCLGHLDPDGHQPTEAVRHRKRALTIGRTLLDGTTSVSMVVPPEQLALIREILQSRRRDIPLIRTMPGSEQDADTSGPEWREACNPVSDEDPRTRKQQDLDTIIDVLTAGAATETADTTSATIHETIVTITAAELEARHGQGWTPGVMAGLPIPTVERRVCTGGIRLLVTSDDGSEPLHLGDRHRAFTPAQRRALTVTAGGRCQYPGCRVPAPYLEAHHVKWWHRDAGPTDVDNGIMLCSHHHHLVHAQHSPIRIIRHDGEHHVVPAAWVGPPEARHRARTGPPRHMPPRWKTPQPDPWGRSDP